MAEEPATRRTATGYLETTTSPAGDAFVVRRAAGASRVDVLGAPPPEGPHTDAPPPGVGWSPARPAPEGGWAHDVPGPASVATLLLAGMPAHALVRMTAPAGAALATAAAHPAPDRAAPAGLRRLERWLRSGDGPRHAPDLHARLTAHPGLAGRLLAWAEELRAAPPTWSLGAPGLSALHPAPTGERTVVLVTDEVAAAPAEWDLGWLLGELLELGNEPSRAPEPVPLAADPLARAVRERYAAHAAGLGAARLDEARLARCTLLRWAVHLHDYASYVGWADDLPDRLGRLALLAARPADALG